MKNRDLLRILKDYNFYLVRSNGHEIYSNGQITVAIPHGHEHSKGLVRRILQHAKLSKQQIQEIL